MSRPIQLLQDQLRPLLLHDVLETGRHIGRGAYGVVSEVKVSGLICAGKTLHEAIVQEETLAKFIEECLCHSQQRHPNIVQLIGVHSRPNNRLPMLVMEYLPLSLTQCLESHRDLPLQIKFPILLDVAKGLNYLHCKRPPIVHRDLTANNILLTSNFVAKVSDLGVSRMTDTFRFQQLSVAPGNSVMMPPEARRDNPVYDYKLDVFSYGCLILHVFTHEWPKPSDEFIRRTGFFQRGNYTLVNEWDRRSRYTTAISNDNPFYLFAKSCLENDPEKRPTMSNAITCAQGAVSSLGPLRNQLEMINEINALRRQVDQLRVQDIHVLEERNEAQTNACLLEEVMEQTQSYTQRLEQEKNEAQDNVNRLQEEKEKLQDQTDQLEQERKRAQDNVNQLQQEKEKLQDQIDQLEQERKRAQDNVNQLQREKEKVETRAHKLEQTEEKVQKYASRLEVEKKQMQENIHRLKQEKMKVQDTINELEQENEKVVSDAFILKEEMQQALQYGHRLEKEMDKVQDYAKALELEKEQTQEIVFKLKQEKKMEQDNVDRLQKEKEKAQKDAYVSKEKMEEVQQYAHRLEEEKEKSHANSCHLERVLEQTQEYACKLEQEMEKAQTDACVLIDGMEQAQKHAQKLEQEKKKTQQYVSTLEQENVSYTNKLQQVKKEMQKKVYSLEQEKKKTQDNAHQLACKLNEEKDKALDLLNKEQIEKISLRRQVDDLERRLKQVQTVSFKVSLLIVIVIIVAILLFKS